MQERAERILVLCRECAVQEVLQEFYAIHSTDLMMVRTFLWESGEYERVIDVVLAGLKLPDPKWRYEAVGLVDRLGDDRCVEPLSRLLSDPIARIRRMALHSLGCQPCKITPLQTCTDYLPQIIEVALHDSSVQVRRHAVYTLSEYQNDPRALLALQTMQAQDPDERVRKSALKPLTCFNNATATGTQGTPNPPSLSTKTATHGSNSALCP